MKQPLLRYLPAEIVHRPKQGFGLPDQCWSKDRLLDLAEDRLPESDGQLTSYLDRDCLRAIWPARDTRLVFTFIRSGQSWCWKSGSARLPCRPRRSFPSRHKASVIDNRRFRDTRSGLMSRIAEPFGKTGIPVAQDLAMGEDVLNEAQSANVRNVTVTDVLRFFVVTGYLGGVLLLLVVTRRVRPGNPLRALRRWAIGLFYRVKQPRQIGTSP